MAKAWRLTDKDVLFTALPLFHSAGQVMVVATALVSGATLVVEPQFSVTRWFSRIVEVGATFACSVGAMGAALLQSDVTWDPSESRLRAMMCTPMDPAQQDQFKERFGVPIWAEAFGQTECLTISLNPVDCPGDRYNGIPAESLEIGILDPEDRRLLDGQVGEICIRPREPGVMFSGYWNRPEATVAATRSLWYHSGDLGRIHPTGSLQFMGRKKESVRRRGENVSMFELETAIVTCSGIHEAAVVGVPSSSSEDDILTYLVPEEGYDLSPEYIFDFFRTHLPYYAIPRYVSLVTTLPKNAMGRVMKHELPGLDGSQWDFEALGLTVKREERRS